MHLRYGEVYPSFGEEREECSRRRDAVFRHALSQMPPVGDASALNHPHGFHPLRSPATIGMIPPARGFVLQ
ncbi:hypothetical protein GCM10027033_20910 [Leucobacter ruminantium]